MTDLFAALDQKIEKDILIIKKHPARNIELEYKELYLKALYLLAASDSFIDREEVKYIEIVAKSIDFKEEDLAEIRNSTEYIDRNLIELFLRRFSSLKISEFPLTSLYFDLFFLARRDKEKTENESTFINQLLFYQPTNTALQIKSLVNHIYSTEELPEDRQFISDHLSYLNTFDIGQLVCYLEPDSPADRGDKGSTVIELMLNLDKEVQLFKNHPAINASLEERSSYLYCIAALIKSDGHLHSNELKMFKLMCKSFGFDGSFYEEALNINNDCIEEAVDLLKSSKYGECLYLDTCLMAYYDKRLSNQEIILLKKFRYLLKLRQSSTESLEKAAELITRILKEVNFFIGNDPQSLNATLESRRSAIADARKIFESKSETLVSPKLLSYNELTAYLMNISDFIQSELIKA